MPLCETYALRWPVLLHDSLFTFTDLSTKPTTSGGPIFRCTTKDRGERRASSSQAPHPSFCLSGQKLSRSSAPPLPTKPTNVGLWRGPYWRPPLNPRGNVLGHSDVLCAYHLATVHLTRLSRAWRAQAHCFHALCVLRCSEKQQDLRNHPTFDHKLRRLFLKCQRFRRSWSSTTESVEAVRSTPRTGLNRVNCITANT